MVVCCIVLYGCRDRSWPQIKKKHGVQLFQFFFSMLWWSLSRRMALHMYIQDPKRPEVLKYFKICVNKFTIQFSPRSHQSRSQQNIFSVVVMMDWVQEEKIMSSLWFGFFYFSVHFTCVLTAAVCSGTWVQQGCCPPESPSVLSQEW